MATCQGVQGCEPKPHPSYLLSTAVWSLGPAGLFGEGKKSHMPAPRTRLLPLHPVSPQEKSKARAAVCHRRLGLPRQAPPWGRSTWYLTRNSSKGGDGSHDAQGFVGHNACFVRGWSGKISWTRGLPGEKAGPASKGRKRRPQKPLLLITLRILGDR